MPRRFLNDREKRQRLRPWCEGLEARDLPSATPLSLGPVSTVPLPERAAALDLASVGIKRPVANPTVIANSVNLLYGPGSTTPQTPTPREVNRQTFVANWVGTYIVGPPRFNDRANSIHFFSKDGGSNQFLKGKMQMVLNPPADPAAIPNPGDPFANQVVGITALFAQNYLQSGTLANLDVSGPPGAGASPGTLPKHLNWTFDSFSSSGAYTAPALNFNQGQGVLDIHYTPDRRAAPGTMGSGRMTVKIQGVINYSQIIASTSRPYN